MFSLYSWSHIATLSLAVALLWFIPKIKLKIGRSTELITTFAIFIFYILHFVYYYYINGFHPGYDMPIFQICGIVMLNLALFLFTKRQFFYSVVYFLGFTATFLAFLLPDLRDDYTRPYFWIFWLPHLVILALVSFVTFNYKIRLSVRDLNQAFIFLLSYLFVFALPFSLMIQHCFGYANYAYMISIPYNIFGIHLEKPFYYPVVLIPTYVFFRLLLILRNKLSV